MRAGFTAALAGALTLAASPALAGPWVKAQGEAYVKVAGSAFQGTSLWDVDANRLDAPFVYSNQALTTYAEVGVWDGLALGLNLPVVVGRNVVEERTTYEQWGGGDLDLFAQGQLFQAGGCAGSGALAVRLPLYEGVISDGTEPGAVGTSGPERFLPALGDGSVDVTPTASLGCSLYPAPVWFGVEAGPNLRTRGFGHGLRYAADLGVWAVPEVLALSARVDGVQRLTDDNDRPTKSFVSVSGGATWRVWNGVGLELNGGFVPWGAFVARGWQVGVGVSYSGALIPGG
jgi:hypothetical protein